MHVEAGFPLEPWLARTIALCKKSMARERGPVKRAPEVGLECLKEDLWTFHGHVAVPGAVWAYAWGLCWMLREIELSKALGPRVLEPTQEDSQAVHTPFKDGPAGVGDNKNVAMLWRKPLLEGGVPGTWCRPCWSVGDVLQYLPRNSCSPTTGEKSLRSRTWWLRGGACSIWKWRATQREGREPWST